MAKITNISKVTSKYTLPDTTSHTSEVESNVSETENMTTSFLKEKSVSKLYAIPKDEVEVTLKLTNNSSYDVENVTITDTIGTGATFKAGSVTIDDTPHDSEDPTTGITLPNSIEKNTSTTIKYTIVIDESPTTAQVELDGNVVYSVNEVTDLEEATPQAEVAITNNGIVIEKTSDKTAVISGDKLLFQNVIKNIGTVKHTEVKFSDQMPEGTTFVPDSVKIDNVVKAGYDPATGFELDDIEPNTNITVTFEVLVD